MHMFCTIRFSASVALSQFSGGGLFDALISITSVISLFDLFSLGFGGSARENNTESIITEGKMIKGSYMK